MSFYLTLPADSSIDYHPQNKLNHFFVRLPNEIQLSGMWEVSLCEIIYPHAWHNITEDGNSFEFDTGDGKVKKARILPGFYESADELLKGISRHFRDKGSNIILYSNKINKRVKIYLKNNARLIFHKGIAENLGFPVGDVSKEIDENVIDNLTERVVESPFLVEPAAEFQFLYVYTNIIEDQIVGNTFAPLLRVVKVEGKYGDVICTSFNQLHYLPLLSKSFQTIEIVIRTHTGRLISFEHGHVIVKLHFRLKQL